MNREMAAAILEHHMPKKNRHTTNKVSYLAYATAINALRNENALIDRVLELIDTLPNDNPSYWRHGDLIDRQAIRDAILALKGEQG